MAVEPIKAKVIEEAKRIENDTLRFIPVGAWGAREITEYESCANYSRSP